MCHRDLDKQEAEIREKLKQEKKREERKNREAFSELLREDMDEGFIKPKMRWKVLSKSASLTWLSVSSSMFLCMACTSSLGPVPTDVNVACTLNRTSASWAVLESVLKSVCAACPGGLSVDKHLTCYFVNIAAFWHLSHQTCCTAGVFTSHQRQRCLAGC